MAGLDGVALGELRVLTLTAPGFDVLRSADDLLEFNRTALARWHVLWSHLARAIPGAAFCRVVELQRRGAVHLHVIVRGGGALSVKRVRRMAVSAGFGPRVEWDAVRAPLGLARYLAGYLAKSRDVFPPGWRVLETSRNWPLTAIEPAAPEVRPEAEEGAAVAVDTTWYGGPPPGVSWWDYAGDLSGVLAGRRYKRLRRARDGLTGFEWTARYRFAAWLLSARGEAAIARQAVKRPAALSPRPARPQAA
jgi:hypothetical protein